MSDEVDMAIERLTQGQIECLLLVHQHLSSKEIAPRLGISSHTVDQRIRASLRILGCNSRTQAAQLVASRRNPASVFDWHAGPAETFVETPSPPQPRAPVRLPFATKDYPTNELSPLARLKWIVVIACGAAFAMGVYLAGLESLARLIKGV
jgi:DNA-binding CsgD family transcriptional regulator